MVYSISNFQPENSILSEKYQLLRQISNLPVNWIIALHMLVAMHVGLKIWMSWTIMEFYIFFLNIFIAIHFKTNCGIFSVAMTILCTSKISRWTRGFWGTGKSLSEALNFASTNPQYDDRLFIVHENIGWRYINNLSDAQR